jgi:hypothetical protein
MKVYLVLKTSARGRESGFYLLFITPRRGGIQNQKKKLKRKGKKVRGYESR